MEEEPKTRIRLKWSFAGMNQRHFVISRGIRGSNNQMKTNEVIMRILKIVPECCLPPSMCLCPLSIGYNQRFS